MNTYKLLAIAAASLAGFAAVPASAEVTTIKCESHDNQERVCRLPKHVQQVVISKQLSDKDCTRGRNWDVRKQSGYDELWVRRGCRAEFAVHYNR